MKYKDLPREIIIYEIFSYILHDLISYNIKELYGYFKNDNRIYPLWSNITISNNKLNNLIPYLSMYDLDGLIDRVECKKQLLPYPNLTSLKLNYYKIKELLPYPNLTSLNINNQMNLLNKYIQNNRRLDI